MKHQFDDTYYNNVLTNIAQKLNLDTSKITPIGDYENMIYEWHIAGIDHILRITDGTRRNSDTLNGELEWLLYLRTHGEFVAGPISINNQPLIHAIPVGEVTFFATFFEKAYGSHLEEADWTNELIHQFGSVLGQMHRLSAQFKSANTTAKRPSWHESILARQHRPQNEALQTVYQKMQTVISTLQAVPTQGEGYGLIHADPNLGNFKLDNGRITFFDFDDCCYSWFVQDIAVLFVDSVNAFCQPNDKKSFTANFFNHFLSGYRQFRQLTSKEIDVMILFAKLRELELYMSLHSLPIDEQYDHEKRFMHGRYDLIKNDTPFIDWPVDYLQ